MRVAILDDWFDTLRSLPSFAKLANHDVHVFTDHVDDTAVLASRLASVDCVILIRERTAVRKPLLDQLPELRLISQRSAYPHIDVDACTQLGIVVSSEVANARPSYATAELTWGLVIAAQRQIPQQMASLRAGRWQLAPGRSLRDRTLGIWGYGRIGGEVARYGRAFGMRVIAWGSGDARARASADGFEVSASSEQLFSDSDILSLHLRLGDTTRGIVTLTHLQLMKADALLVNTSRAELIQPGALIEALISGHPGMAAIDVFEHEPLVDTGYPLLAMPNVICTPHIGYVTREEWDFQFSVIFDQVNAFAAGSPLNVVNPEVLQAANLRR